MHTHRAFFNLRSAKDPSKLFSGYQPTNSKMYLERQNIYVVLLLKSNTEEEESQRTDTTRL